MFYTFDFLKDKLSFMWRSAETPYFFCKTSIAAFSAYLSLIFSYPWYFTKTMVDFWPKPANGVCNYGNNYRKAANYFYTSDLYNIGYPGFFNNYFWKQFPLIFGTLMIADSLGIFSYNINNYWADGMTNSWEDSIC